VRMYSITRSHMHTAFNAHLNANFPGHKVTTEAFRRLRSVTLGSSAGQRGSGQERQEAEEGDGGSFGGERERIRRPSAPK